MLTRKINYKAACLKKQRIINIFFESIRFLIKFIEKSPKSGFYFCGNYVKNGG